jgi:hypothetical protein
MNHNHLPRLLVTLLLILVAGTFFVGTLRAFVPGRAGAVMDDLVLKADLPTATSVAGFSTPGPTPTLLSESLLPSPTEEEAPLPTPVATSAPVDHTVYADTTGIIALAILLVVVVLVGTILGERKPKK